EGREEGGEAEGQEEGREEGEAEEMTARTEPDARARDRPNPSHARRASTAGPELHERPRSATMAGSGQVRRSTAAAQEPSGSAFETVTADRPSHTTKPPYSPGGSRRNEEVMKYLLQRTGMAVATLALAFVLFAPGVTQAQGWGTVKGQVVF